MVKLLITETDAVFEYLYKYYFDHLLYIFKNANIFF